MARIVLLLFSVLTVASCGSDPPASISLADPQLSPGEQALPEEAELFVDPDGTYELYIGPTWTSISQPGQVPRWRVLDADPPSGSVPATVNLFDSPIDPSQSFEEFAESTLTTVRTALPDAEIQEIGRQHVPSDAGFEAVLQFQSRIDGHMIRTTQFIVAQDGRLAYATLTADATQQALAEEAALEFMATLSIR